MGLKSRRYISLVNIDFPYGVSASSKRHGQGAEMIKRVFDNFMRLWVRERWVGSFSNCP